jgi:hypothetical protein
VVRNSPALKPIDHQKARSSSPEDVVEKGNQETEIEFLTTNIYLLGVELRTENIVAVVVIAWSMLNGMGWPTLLRELVIERKSRHIPTKRNHKDAT